MRGPLLIRPSDRHSIRLTTVRWGRRNPRTADGLGQVACTRTKGTSPMEPVYRKEIHAFVLACETILARVLLVPPMTAEEKALVQTYVTALQARCKAE